MNEPFNKLDESLESPDQKAVSGWVRDLPTDEVNMTWRAQLNDRLAAVAPPARKRWIGPVWRSGLSIGLAAALGVVYFSRSHSPAPALPSASLEATLISAHQSTVARAEVGTGTLESSTDPVEPYQYNESDLDTL